MIAPSRSRTRSVEQHSERVEKREVGFTSVPLLFDSNGRAKPSTLSTANAPAEETPSESDVFADPVARLWMIQPDQFPSTCLSQEIFEFS
jgi:hypothetical protein